MEDTLKNKFFWPVRSGIRYALRALLTIFGARSFTGFILITTLYAPIGALRAMIRGVVVLTNTYSSTVEKVGYQILGGLVAGIPGEQFYLDIPVPNAAAVALVQDRKMTPIFSTARLYSRRDPVPLPLDEIFGVTTFEPG